MRRSVLIAASIAVVLVLSGCSHRAPLAQPPAAQEPTVLGISGASTQTAATSTPSNAVTGSATAPNSAAAPNSATTPNQGTAPNPTSAEGMPASVGIQATSAEGTTTITRVKALKIADAHKPVGATTATVRHVLFATKGSSKPVDAWMVTFRGVQLPGASGGLSGKTGSVTLFIDSTSGAVVDQVAYEPVAK